MGTSRNEEGVAPWKLYRLAGDKTVAVLREAMALELAPLLSAVAGES